MKTAIIDFEFTGLDNGFITDNEIVQAKVCNPDTLRSYCVNFSSTKKISAYGFLSHKTENYTGCDKFSKEKFELMLQDIQINSNDVIYYGFSTQQDALMLKKYGINIEIKDIREMLQLSSYEQRMATEGSGLEATYYIVTGKLPELESHSGLDELRIIRELYECAIKIEQRKHFTVMPFGFCAGMPISKYVLTYRRQADGYRYNNNDTLSESLTSAIEAYEDEADDEDWDGDDRP